MARNAWGTSATLVGVCLSRSRASMEASRVAALSGSSSQCRAAAKLHTVLVVLRFRV